MELTANNNWKSPKYILMLAGIIVLGVIIVVAIIRDRIVNPNQWQISVSGQGKISYQPDTANINLGVRVDKAAKAEDALKQLNDKMNKILAAVKKIGVAPENIQTQNYALSPHYDTVDGIQKLNGYDANQIIIVKIKDIQANTNLIAGVVSEATKAGTNQINGISFENSKINDLKAQARLMAIADARAKSGEIARSLGVKLGKVAGMWENIVSPSESQISYKGDMGGIGGGGAASTEPVIPTGAQELIIETNVSYQIK